MRRGAAAPQKRGFRKLQRKACRCARLRGLSGVQPTAAVDGTGLDSRHASRHSTRRWDRVRADAAHDAEHNHRLCREDGEIRSPVIPLNRRSHGRKWPQTKYRRQMVKHFRKKRRGARHRRVYGQRWQVESVFARHKRLLGAALRARSEAARERECFLRVLTHNLMLLAAVA